MKSKKVISAAFHQCHVMCSTGFGMQVLSKDVSAVLHHNGWVFAFVAHADTSNQCKC
jgi:hypothetical protein